MDLAPAAAAGCIHAQGRKAKHLLVGLGGVAELVRLAELAISVEAGQYHVLALVRVYPGWVSAHFALVLRE